MNNPRKTKRFRFTESKTLLIITALIGSLALSSATLWVIHSVFIDSSAILEDPNYVTEERLETDFVPKSNFNNGTLYERKGSGETTEFIPAPKDKYLARKDIPNGHVFKRENFGDETIFINEDENYFKKADYDGGVLYDVNGQNENLTLTPSDLNNFFINNNYTKALFYKRTGTGNNTVLTEVDVTNEYLRKSDYDQALYKRTGSGNNTSLTPLDKSLYSTLSLQCVKPILHNYRMIAKGGINNNTEILLQPKPREGIKLFTFVFSDGDVGDITTSAVYVYENPDVSGGTSNVNPNSGTFTLERGESKTFYFVGTVSIGETHRADYVAAFTHVITRDENDNVITTRGDLAVIKRNVGLDSLVDVNGLSYNNIVQNRDDSQVNFALLNSTYKPQQPYNNWDHWKENCFLTKKVN